MVKENELKQLEDKLNAMLEKLSTIEKETKEEKRLRLDYDKMDLILMHQSVENLAFTKEMKKKREKTKDLGFG